MPARKPSFKHVVLRETAVFLSLLLAGLVILPIVIYLVGDQVFGHYGGHGLGGFFNSLSGRIRSADGVAWFLVLSPYLGWLILRLTLGLWRLAGPPRDETGRKTS